MLRRLIGIVGATLIFALATAVTQLGGVAFLLALLLVWIVRRSGMRKSVAVIAGIVFFIAGLGIANRFIVPPLAAQFGRAPLPCAATGEQPYAALSPLYCALGRNYVRPEARAMLDAMASDLAQHYPGLTVAYLDAGFPFFDGFPLPPHLSHHDGRRIDLAYFYKDRAGTYQPLATPSLLGYWGFEPPSTGDASPCDDKERWLTLRWDMGWFQAFVRQDLVLDEERTAVMLRWLTERGSTQGVEKILLEPHVAKRLQVSSPLIRFQGCRAARHDDHIHVEVGYAPGPPS
ncbi:hypothetical protein [Taklimakanibacter deserti]|uniref:hypothetical protein n=1 Tax=Taklimakanibacter deserti TaxID=2267839 RepID=UPI000E647F57